MPRVSATTAGWPDLIDELDRWEAAGYVAKLWWRDDDAVAVTSQLRELLRVAGGTPLGLAVIPARAEPELADALLPALRVAVLQHGWRHVNHAHSGKKSEFPPGRLASAVAAEIAAGRVRLQAMFGALALPIFVPPWNRFAPEHLPLLAAHGITGFSAMASRRGPVLCRGLIALDVHIDLVAWKSGRRFIGTDAALAGLIGNLRAVRLAAGDLALPIGILTHHAIMDGATAGFLARLIEIIENHAAARWTAASELVQ